MRVRLNITCPWCSTVQRADTYADLRERYGRHLRNCGAFRRKYLEGKFHTGAPFTMAEVIDGILQRSGLSPEGQTLQAEAELAKVRAEVQADPNLSEAERAELLAQLDKPVGTPTHEATGRTLAPALEQVEVNIQSAREVVEEAIVANGRPVVVAKDREELQRLFARQIGPQTIVYAPAGVEVEALTLAGENVHEMHDRELNGAPTEER